MKKIINEKKYDTETAVLLKDTIADHPDYSLDDLSYCDDFYVERLYRKKTGEYFLYGIGGGRSKYGRTIFLDLEIGEKITPLTEEEAKKWAEENMDGDEYEAIFGEVEE